MIAVELRGLRRTTRSETKQNSCRRGFGALLGYFYPRFVQGATKADVAAFRQQGEIRRFLEQVSHAQFFQHLSIWIMF